MDPRVSRDAPRVLDAFEDDCPLGEIYESFRRCFATGGKPVPYFAVITSAGPKDNLPYAEGADPSPAGSPGLR
jgi:hypothetical protein